MQFLLLPVLALRRASLSGIKPPSYCSISPVYLSIYDEIQKNMRKLFG